MAARECYHCKQLIEPGDDHDCWTTTEAALTKDLSEDLRDAWERLRETAIEFGDQRIYASHHSIMFARKACYFFVRPKLKFLDVCIFLRRPLKSALVLRSDATSKTKYANMLRIQHRDQVEAPITEWLQEAYAFEDAPKAAAPGAKAPKKSSPRRKRRSPAAKARRRR